MPQMAPIQWDLLMLFSFLILLFMLAKVYFSFKDQNNDKIKESLNNKMNKTLEWVW